MLFDYSDWKIFVTIDTSKSALVWRVPICSTSPPPTLSLVNSEDYEVYEDDEDDEIDEDEDEYDEDDEDEGEDINDDDEESQSWWWLFCDESYLVMKFIKRWK